MFDSPSWRFAAGTGLLAALSVGGAPAADWSDTSVGYRYGTQFTEPGNLDEVAKHLLQFSPVSGHSLGQNVFSLDVLRSDGAASASGSDYAGQRISAEFTYCVQL